MKMQKNSMLKRGLAVLLAVVMCAGLAMPAWAAGTEPKVDDQIGWCHCGGALIYGGFCDANGYGYYCNNCGRSGQTFDIDTSTSAPGAPITGNFCPKCGKATLQINALSEDDQAKYCHDHYCPSCDYKDVPEHRFGSSDTAYCLNGCGYKNPTYVPLPEGVILAECGGTFRYDDTTGLAIVLTKGTECVDVNLHDHECDYCHAPMREDEWKVTETIGAATCLEGAKTVTKCKYEGCQIFTPQVTYGKPLDPVFSGWAYLDKDTHLRYCVNCEGKADGHREVQDHVMTLWSEWTQTSGTPEGAPQYNPDTHTLWVKSHECTVCGYKETQYETRSKDPRKHILTINYVYADDNGEKGQAFESHVKEYAEGETYNVKSPDAPEGYQIESGMDYVRGVMSTGDTNWTVKYEPIPYKVVVKYVEAGTNELIGEPYEETHYIGDEVKITPTAPEGWKLVKPATPIEFTMGAEDEEIWIHCERLTEYKVTVNYVDENGNAIADIDPVTVDTTNGGKYNVNGLKVDIEDYTFQEVEDNQALEGTATEDITITLIYKQNEVPETYTVTYTDGVDGEEIFRDQEYSGLEAGVNTPSFAGAPSRPGYTFEGWSPAVADTVTSSITYRAQWSRDPDPTPAPPTATPTPTPTPTPSATPSAEPTDEPTEIPDPEPPLTESPDVTPTPSTPPVTPDPEPSEPPVEIPDDDPPLAEIPDEDPPLAEIPDDTTEIEDEVVPLADVPKTGDDAKIWLTLALLSAAGLGVIGLMQRRTRRNGKDS